MAQCPAHPDNGPSLSIREAEDRVLLYCFAGCSTDAVLASLGLSWTMIGGQPRIRLAGSARQEAPSKPSRATERRERTPLDAEGVTLRQYSEARALPLDLLTQTFAMSDTEYAGLSAIRMPYLDEGAHVVANRFRLGLIGKDRFRWKKGDVPTLYGRWLHQRWEAAGFVILVEGESDVHTLVSHSLPAAGVPGANHWMPEWEAFLAGVPMVYLWMEPDAGGEAFLKSIGRTDLRHRMRVIMDPQYKDPSEVHREAGDFTAHVSVLLQRAK